MAKCGTQACWELESPTHVVHPRLCSALRYMVQAKQLHGILGQPCAASISPIGLSCCALILPGKVHSSIPAKQFVTDSVVTCIAGRAAPAEFTPAVGSVLAAGYGSDEEEVGPASIQGSAATAAEQRDSGSQSANGLPSNFFEVCLFEVFFEGLSTKALCSGSHVPCTKASGLCKPTFKTHSRDQLAFHDPVHS